MKEQDLAEVERSAAAIEWGANWKLVVAATLGLSLASIPAGSTGIMMAPIEAEFGWSRTQIYSGVALISFIGVGLATFIGMGIDRLGARRIGITAAILLCCAIASLSLVDNSLWQWWTCWVFVGLACAAMPTVWLTPVASRFKASRGLAVAIVLSGSGLATFFVPIIAHTLVQNYGWRTGYLGLSMIWALLSLPFLVLFFWGSAPAPGAAANKASAIPAELRPGLSVREGFASPTFYKLLFAAFGSIFGGVALVLNLVPVLVSSGVQTGTAATVAGLIGISTIIGRVMGGWLSDRMSAKVIAAGSTIAAAGLPVALLLFPGSVGGAIFGVLAYGFAGGAKMGALAYLASRHLGERSFGTLYGTINAIIALAVGIAPLAANYIYDVTKSYEPVMWAAVPILAVAALLYASLSAYPEFAEEAGVPQPSR